MSVQENKDTLMRIEESIRIGNESLLVGKQNGDQLDKIERDIDRQNVELREIRSMLNTHTEERTKLGGEVERLKLEQQNMEKRVTRLEDANIPERVARMESVIPCPAVGDKLRPGGK